MPADDLSEIELDLVRVRPKAFEGPATCASQINRNFMGLLSLARERRASVGPRSARARVYERIAHAAEDIVDRAAEEALALRGRERSERGAVVRDRIREALEVREVG